MIDGVEVTIPLEIYERVKQKADTSHRIVQGELEVVIQRGLGLLGADEIFFCWNGICTVAKHSLNG